MSKEVAQNTNAFGMDIKTSVPTLIGGALGYLDIPAARQKLVYRNDAYIDQTVINIENLAEGIYQARQELVKLGY